MFPRIVFIALAPCCIALNVSILTDALCNAIICESNVILEPCNFSTSFSYIFLRFNAINAPKQYTQ